MRTAMLLAAALVLVGSHAGATAAEAPRPGISVLSNRADLISGGDALVAVAVPPGVAPSRVRVAVERRVRGRVRRRNVTGAFAVRPNGRFEGLVTDLPLGRSVLRASIGWRRGARAVVINHPNGGPVFSGPQVQPWVCQDTAVDAQCNQPAEYELLYQPTGPGRGFEPYDPASPPSDVATTTTDEGVRVPFVIRVETGYQDRDQYKIATLYLPGEPWEPWAPQEQWNHKLLITHGGGCGVAYEAGNAPSVTEDNVSLGIPLVDGAGGATSVPLALGRGFAVMSTALNNNGHNCNIAVQAESLLMAKEHVVEAYGPLRYTIGTGCSGGSLTQQQVANAYPGIYQGLLTTCSFPDSWSSAAQVMDYHLYRAYFEDPSRWGPGIVWTPEQMAAVEGHVAHLNAITSDEGFFNAVVPTYPCGGVTDEQRYHPQTNPGGVRCGLPDYMINVLGPRPEDAWSPVEQQLGRGFAGVPLGNAGVQYGLDVLRRGQITPAQFVDLNTKLGGLDVDINPTAGRLAADPQALSNAYRSGAINEANNLDQVAIIDLRGPDPAIAHDAYRTWAVRARLEREQGHYRNHVIWFGHAPVIGDTTYMREALLAMDRWLGAVEADGADKPLAQKIVDDRPADIRDRCSQVALVELISLSGAGRVCELAAVQGRYGTPRTVAGQSIATDINECALQPLRRSDFYDYPVQFTDPEWERLTEAFPTGVCDWAKPGVGQTDTIPWLTYQERNGDVIYGGRQLGAAPGGSGSGWTSPTFASWRRR